MKISIALRNNAGSNDAYATYDTDNQVSVYVSFVKAEMLKRMIDKFINPWIVLPLHKNLYNITCRRGYFGRTARKNKIYV